MKSSQQLLIMLLISFMVPSSQAHGGSWHLQDAPQDVAEPQHNIQHIWFEYVDDYVFITITHEAETSTGYTILTVETTDETNQNQFQAQYNYTTQNWQNTTNNFIPDASEEYENSLFITFSHDIEHWENQTVIVTVEHYTDYHCLIDQLTTANPYQEEQTCVTPDISKDAGFNMIAITLAGLGLMALIPGRCKRNS